MSSCHPQDDSIIQNLSRKARTKKEPEPDILSEAENSEVPVEVQNVEVPVVNVAITRAKLQTIAKVVAHVAQVMMIL